MKLDFIKSLRYCYNVPFSFQILSWFNNYVHTVVYYNCIIMYLSYFYLLFVIVLIKKKPTKLSICRHVRKRSQARCVK